MSRGVAVRYEQRDRRIREVGLLEGQKIFVLGVVQDGDFKRGFLEGGDAQFPPLRLSCGDVGLARFQREGNVLDVRDLNRPLSPGYTAEQFCIKTELNGHRNIPFIVF